MTRSRGSSVSADDVKPRRSQNRTVDLGALPTAEPEVPSTLRATSIDHRRRDEAGEGVARACSRSKAVIRGR